jgi:hypothetical protein
MAHIELRRGFFDKRAAQGEEHRRVERVEDAISREPHMESLSRLSGRFLFFIG